MTERRENGRARLWKLFWVIQRVVQAPTLFAHHRAADNQLGNLHQIAQFQ